MNFKKRVNGSWTDIPHYIHNTSTDTLTTLPAVLYPNAVTATVGLKGNMSQSSTPTPATPIQPQESGERTGNLFDENYPNIKVDTPTYRSIYVGDGTFTLSTTTAQYGDSANVFFLAGNVRSGASTRNNGIWNGNPRTVTAVDGYVTIAYRYYMGDEESDPRSNDVMLNTGSTALPYEPYGYKIPISSANTTTPIYLGEAQTTRKIKEKVFDGTENWRRSVNGAMYLSPFTGESYKKEVAITSMNSHFAAQINTTSGTDQVGDNSSCFLAASGSAEYYIGARSYATATDFKTYLAQQYANGTPVTIWYVLATPTTGIVNEPLRKIGDYADTVSGITISTTAGANSFDVLTTLKPSEVTVNYKGWHPAQSVHEYDSNYTIATMQALTIAQLQTHTISELQGGEWS